MQQRPKDAWFRQTRVGFIVPVHWKAYALFGAGGLFLLVSELALSKSGLLEKNFSLGLIPLVITFFALIAISASRTKSY